MFTAEEIAERLNIDKSTIDKIARKHHLRNKPFAEWKNGSCVYYEHTIPIFEMIIQAIADYSKMKEEERGKVKRVLTTA